MTGTFSTSAEKDSVISFREKLVSEEKLGSLEATFDSILQTIDKNIIWRNENEGKIVDWIKSQESSASKISVTSIIFLTLGIFCIN